MDIIGKTEKISNWYKGRVSFNRPIYQGTLRATRLNDHGVTFASEDDGSYKMSLAAFEEMLTDSGVRMQEGYFQGTFVLRSDRQGIALLDGKHNEEWGEFQNQQELDEYLEDLRSQDLLHIMPCQYNGGSK